MTATDVAKQVADYWVERGLVPVVRANGGKPVSVHGSSPETPLWALCEKGRRQGRRPVRAAVGADLVLRPCRKCTKQYIHLLLKSIARSA